MDAHTILPRQFVLADAGHALPLLLGTIRFRMAPLLAGLLGLATPIFSLLLDSVTGHHLLLCSLAIAFRLCAFLALLYHDSEIPLTSLASLGQRFQHMVLNLVVKRVELSRRRRIVRLE